MPLLHLGCDLSHGLPLVSVCLGAHVCIMCVSARERDWQRAEGTCGCGCQGVGTSLRWGYCTCVRVCSLNVDCCGCGNWLWCDAAFMGNDPAHHLSPSFHPVTNYLIPCGFVSSFPYKCLVCSTKWEHADEGWYIQTKPKGAPPACSHCWGRTWWTTPLSLIDHIEKFWL